MKLAIAAAGTGGHIIPALNIACYLQNQITSSPHTIHWICTPTGMENQIIPPHNIPMHPITFSGVRKKGLMRWLALPFTLFKSTRQATSILKSIQPDAVLVMGGYVSVPTAIASFLKGIPLIIHEQNSIPGLANKLCSIFAHKVCYAFAGSFKGKTNNKYIHTGNPINHSLHTSIKTTSSKIKHSGFHILILGGSLGAKTINITIPQALAKLQEKVTQPLLITHQCGRNHLHETKQCYQQTSLYAENVDIIEFSDSLPDLYQQADMIVARAGAMSVAEINSVGCPALFIPYPHAVNDHQYHNAKNLQNNPQYAHLYAIIRDQQLTIDNACEKLYQLYKAIQQHPLDHMETKHLSATKNIVCIIEQTIAKNS